MAHEPQPEDYEHDKVGSRLNWLRAGVLGANDGIVSMAALLVGVLAVDTSFYVVFTAGFAGLAAGALSMGIGEYVSVSTQRDAEAAMIAREKRWHKLRPTYELAQLIRLHQESGMSEDTARRAATEQMQYDALGAHARAHLGVDPDELTSPVQAGVASFIAFSIGGIAPMLTALVPPADWRIPMTFGVVVVALVFTGWGAARLGHAPRLKAILRTAIGGAAAMAITYGIGQLVGTTIV